ncbi:MAG: alpha,alpha-trehalase, partial [Chitinophagales bacterium]|nr:alpha,alpha-trehalase [Chitinophagales bacterium]MDW8428337.1 trehalase family glycosidase [Chitinophagales bacterium]
LEAEYDFWVTRRGTPTGLSHYGHDATEAYLLEFYQHLKQVRLPLPEASDAEKIYVAGHRLAEAESGYDFTPRFEGRCADFLAVDLNSNLYRYEVLMQEFAQTLKNGQESQWAERAQQRRRRINRFLWDEATGLYRDYDYLNNRFSQVPSAATFHPLWTGLASNRQARRVIDNLKLFEYEYGITPCPPGERTYTYQWDYPNTWPPHALIVSEALDRYGFLMDGQRIRDKYLKLVYSVFQSTGMLWEKYNAVTGNVQVNEEYKTPPMMGWTAGVYAAFSLRH